MNNESVITMAAAKTEASVGRGRKAGDKDKLAAKGHTQQSTLSGNGNGGSNCDGVVDDDVAR